MGKVHLVDDIRSSGDSPKNRRFHDAWGDQKADMRKGRGGWIPDRRATGSNLTCP